MFNHSSYFKKVEIYFLCILIVDTVDFFVMFDYLSYSYELTSIRGHSSL
jgi:hypothetical protein